MVTSMPEGLRQVNAMLQALETVTATIGYLYNLMEIIDDTKVANAYLISP